MSQSLQLVVASANPVKLAAVRRGFESVWRGRNCSIVSVSVDSRVPDQPLSDAETLAGAENRARGARAAEPAGEYWFGLEGGVEPSPHGLLTFAWIVVIGSGSRMGRARSAS